MANYHRPSDLARKNRKTDPLVVGDRCGNPSGYHGIIKHIDGNVATLVLETGTVISFTLGTLTCEPDEEAIQRHADKIKATWSEEEKKKRGKHLQDPPVEVMRWGSEPKRHGRHPIDTNWFYSSDGL
jgi:hypothetical protein